VKWQFHTDDAWDRGMTIMESGKALVTDWTGTRPIAHEPIS